jgi:hypothetical protein
MLIVDAPFASKEAALTTSKFRVLWVALLFLLLVGGGFGPTLYLRPLFGEKDWLQGTASLPPHLFWHGTALTAWFVLFAVQAGLIATRRTALHRQLGIAGLCIALAVVVTSVQTMMHFLPRVEEWGSAHGMGPAQLEPGIRMRVVPPVVGGSLHLPVFALFVGAGIYFRSRPATHKRCMLLASLNLVGPALSSSRRMGQLFEGILPAQLAGAPFGLLLLFCYGALVWHDLVTRRRVEPATWWGLASLVTVEPVGRLIASSDAGLAYVRWLSSVAT